MRPVCGLLLLLFVLSACTSVGGTDAAPSPTPSTVSVAAIREARAAVADPAAELVAAARATTASVARLREQPPPAPAARTAATAAVADGPLARLEAAAAEARRVAISSPSAVAQAWGEAVNAGAAVATTAAADLAVIVAAAEADAALADLVAAWDEPGSYSQQLTRLADVAAAAASLSQLLGARADVAECLSTFDRRSAAAARIEERTRDLRRLVAERQGGAFDQQRDSYRAAPLGGDAPLVEQDAAEFRCWRTRAPLAGASTRLEEALASLQLTLNPPALMESEPGTAAAPAAVPTVRRAIA